MRLHDQLSMEGLTILSAEAQLRSDPITRTWVHVGQQEDVPKAQEGCPLCHIAVAHPLLEIPKGGAPQVLVIPHFDPQYRIEGAHGRRGNGIYDCMRPVGAHEIIIESPDHHTSLSMMSDERIEYVLEAYALRLLDLKRDPRFRYVAVSKDHGKLSGSEWEHSYSEVIATVFLPPSVLYELWSARRWYEEKERCVFCDVLHQEERQGERLVDAQGDFVAFCPYAARVPFETWVMSRRHSHLYEQQAASSDRRNLAALLGRLLRRIEHFSDSYHLVLYTAPNTAPQAKDPPSYWLTLSEDFHWHIEILPVLERRGRPPGIKEVYSNALLPEAAAEQLRRANGNGTNRIG